LTPALLAVLGALAALVWVGLRFGSARATPISPDDPLWREAIRRARATSSSLREFHESGREVWIKFTLGMRGKPPEHVWGRLLWYDGAILICKLETPPISGSAFGSEPIRVAPDELEDWQVTVDEGSIHGGFTTRAQVQIAERDGQPVPRHIRYMLSRMVD
jgi:hypothetical protein